MNYNFTKKLFNICLFWLIAINSLAAQVFVPLAGSNQINCGQNSTLCEHAGCSADYSPNADGYTILQTIGSAAISLSGSYLLGAGDQIIIYSGAGVGGSVIATLTGNGTYTFNGSAGQQITIRFVSDATEEAAGFSFNISYIGSCTFPSSNFGTTGTQSFPCASNRIFYDNGGAASDYSNSVNSTVVLNNAGTGVYSIGGSYIAESGYDFIYIYNGVGTSGTLLQTFTGSGTINFTTQPGQTITIQFVSDASIVSSGFQINVSHYGGCSCPTNIIAATADPSSICIGGNSQLNVSGTAFVANYAISYPTYAPLSCSGSSSGAGPSGDDVSSSPITLPFAFNFFGNTYTQFGITTNGNIQFGPGPYSNIYTPSGSGIPTTTIDNIVALNFADWMADAGDINWYVQGTAPNRVVVICFNGLYPYPIGSAGSLTGQIILYETSNVIDLVITTSSMGITASTYDIQTQGLQEVQGSGLPVPGRNATTWSTSNNTVRFTPTLNYSYQWSPATFLNSTTLVNPLATNVTSSQTYTVTATLGTQCTQTTSVAVNVNAAPSATISGTSAICSGQSTTLTAAGGSSYLWSDGETTAAVTLSPGNTTTYTVTVSNGGCSATASRTISVTATPVPRPAAVPNTICVGQSSTISALGSGSFVWSTGATTSSITVSPATTTTYSVTVNNGGCIGIGSATVTVSLTGAPIINCPANIDLVACQPVAVFATPSAIDPCAAPSCNQALLSDILSNFNANSANITGPIPSPFNFTLDGPGGASGSYIDDGGNDMYDGGNYLNTNLGTNIPYTNGSIVGNALLGIGGQYFTLHVNNLFVMAADINGISSFSITGNNGADGTGVVNGFTYTVTVGCQTYNVFVKRINGAGDPSINQIFIVPAGTLAGHSFSISTDDTQHILSNLTAAQRLYYLLLAGNAGYAYTNAQIQSVVLNFLTEVGASEYTTAALTVTQTAGLPSGSTFPIGTTPVSFSATGSSGTATCSFNVTVQPVPGPFMTCPPAIALTNCNPVANFAAATAIDPCFEPCAVSSLSTILSNFNTNGAAITGAIPNPFNFVLDGPGGATSTYIGDGGGDMYDGGNYLSTNISTNIAYTGGAVLSNAAFGVGGQYFTQKINNMFVMVADINGISNFSTTGNNGADGAGNVNGFTYTVTVGCETYDVFVKRVNAAADPSINHIFIVPSGNGVSHNFSTDSNDDLHNLNNLTAVTRLYYLLVAGNAGYAYTNAQIQTIVQNFLTQVNATVAAPVTITQIAGLPSGSSFPLGTTVNTYQAVGPSGTNTCSFNVVVTPGVTVTAGTDRTVCANNPSLAVSGSVLNATGGIWTTSGSGIFAAPTSLNTTYTPSAADIAAGTVTLRLTSTGNGSCPAAFDELVVSISPAPAPAAGLDRTVCANNSTVSLSGSVANATGGIWSSSGTGSFFPSTTNLSASYTPSAADVAAGTFTLRLTTTGNGNCFAVFDELVVNITAAPSVAVSADQTICANAIANISGMVTNATGGIWTSSGSGSFSPSNSNLNPIYSPSAADAAAGFVTLRLTSTGNPVCLATFDELVLTLSPLSTAPTITGVTGTVCPNTNVTLNASGGTVGAGSVINWYSGPNGTGTLLATGSSYSFAPSSNTVIYARREGNCNRSSDASINISTKNYIYAPNGASSNTYCTDNFGWHHFYIGDDIIYSVRGDLSGAAPGFPQVSIYVNGSYYQDAAAVPTAVCAGGSSPGEERFEMARSWNLDLNGTPIGSYRVRFYYIPSERTDIETAAVNWMSTYSNCGYSYKYATPLGFYWFKNSGTDYVAPLYDDTHYAATIGTTSNGINYSEWSGIPGFSGGSGAVILEPNVVLPVKWLYFNGETVGNINKLQWATATEENTDYFELQRSSDGFNFETIGQINATGNSQETSLYGFDDLHPLKGLNYYRLRLLDKDGASELSNVVVLDNEGNEKAYSFYPNPTNDVVFYQYNSELAEELEVEILDVLGRLLSKKLLNATVGSNQLRIDMSNLLPGSYLIRVKHLSSSLIRTEKLVKK